jgi:hypothetical protein
MTSQKKLEKVSSIPSSKNNEPIAPLVPPGESEKLNLESQRQDFHAEQVAKTKGKKYVKKADRMEDEKLNELAASLSAMGGEMLKFVSARMPNPLPPTDTEIETFMGASTELVKKYLPLANQYQPELVFVGFLVFFVTPRLWKEKSSTIEDRLVKDAQAVIDSSRGATPSPL